MTTSAVDDTAERATASAEPAAALAAPGPTDDVLRVERGRAEPEELAAVTAVLLARAAAQPATESRARSKAGWRRLERERGFHAPHSWRV